MPNINLYPEIIHANDLSPEAAGSDIDAACNEIHAACKGFGTDEDRLIKALGSQNATARSVIPSRYEELHGKNLRKVMKSECGGDLGTALQFLAVTPVQMECDMIQKACKGIGTNELVLFPVICGGRSNEEMQILKKEFFNYTGKDLGRYLDAELGGDLEKLFFTCLQAHEEGYDPDFHNDDLVTKDIEELYNAGQGKMGTDEQKMFKILVGRPAEHLKVVNLKYAEKHGYTLMKCLEKELAGHVKDAAMYMLGMKAKPYETVAQMIKKACAGFGTNELLLTCCLLRYQPIITQVDTAHTELYGKSINDRVVDEAGGDYKKLLLQVLDAA